MAVAEPGCGRGVLELRGKSTGGPQADPDEDPASNPYGRGDYDPATGLWDWYEYPPEVQRARDGLSFTWPELFAHWPLICADLHAEYGIDVDSGILRRRRASWLCDRVLGLLHRDTPLARVMRPDNDK